MPVNKVVAVRTKYKPYQFLHHDVYKLRPDRKHVWLQKLCIRILKKLGANWIEDRETVEHFRIDSDKFIKNLFDQIREIQDEFSQKPKMVLIGSADYHKLMGEKDFHTMFQFESTYNYGAPKLDRYGDHVGTIRTVVPLEVRVIPWMQGILVLP